MSTGMITEIVGDDIVPQIHTMTDDDIRFEMNMAAAVQQGAETTMMTTAVNEIVTTTTIHMTVTVKGPGMIG